MHLLVPFYSTTMQKVVPSRMAHSYTKPVSFVAECTKTSVRCFTFREIVGQRDRLGLWSWNSTSQSNALALRQAFIRFLSPWTWNRITRAHATPRNSRRTNTDRRRRRNQDREIYTYLHHDQPSTTTSRSYCLSLRKCKAFTRLYSPQLSNDDFDDEHV